MPRPGPASDVPRFEFEPTSAVAAARSHSRYVACPGCQKDTAQYLFHRGGVRFVRCGSCGAVYVNPAREQPLNTLLTERFQFSDRDRELMARDTDELLRHIRADYERIAGKPLQRTLWFGAYLPEYADAPTAREVGLELAEIDDDKFRALALDSDISWLSPLLANAPQVVVLNELLEACANPGDVIASLVAALPPSTIFVVTYTNAESLPARMLRRYWASFFEFKSTYFTTGNLTSLLGRYGLVLKAQFAMPVHRSAERIGNIANRILPGLGISTVSRALSKVSVPLKAGNRVAVFGRAQLEEQAREKLSIVLPVFNEVRFCAQVIEAVLAKQLKIDRELIIVESNSTDGTRDIVKTFEGRAGVKVVYEDKPRGKGHAVRTGLQHVTGTIVLIQDADFEYDIDDYDALLEPILQRKAMFVLGSRSLGLDDWKVRKYDTTPIKGFALNFAQVMFAKTYNVLYQQRVTDVNTMFKVFRSECLDGLDLVGNGFELDIELACKLARNGNSPMEVPVNYAARGFEDGKKIRFWRDAIPSYLTLFRFRF
jgi:ribosomal protein S27E